MVSKTFVQVEGVIQISTNVRRIGIRELKIYHSKKIKNYKVEIQRINKLIFM